MPNLHLVSAEGLRKAIGCADYLAHVMPENALDVELRIKLDTYHADLLSEAEQRVEDGGRGQAEEDGRAAAHAAWAHQVYCCSCGYQGTGLAAIEQHLDDFPDENAHIELTGPRPPHPEETQP